MSPSRRAYHETTVFLLSVCLYFYFTKGLIYPKLASNLVMLLVLALNIWSSCLYLPSSGITGMYYYNQKKCFILFFKVDLNQGPNEIYRFMLISRSNLVPHICTLPCIYFPNPTATWFISLALFFFFKRKVTPFLWAFPLLKHCWWLAYMI